MRGAWYVSNRAQGASARPLGPGNYTLSNHLLDTPWPKTRRLRQALDGFPVEQLGQSAQPVFDILRDTRPGRSEEHTSELQSLMRISYAVFCLKKTTTHKRPTK